MGKIMQRLLRFVAIALSAAFFVIAFGQSAFAQDSGSPTRPNILVIMADDIGYWNISAYNRGMMGYRTPNIDRIASEGAIFTDYYGQQSCTAGRAAFITGQSPFVRSPESGAARSKGRFVGQDPTLAELLKPLGYMTGQFGKNHLGDRNEFLPTAHGFDEFFGNLYHLNAEDEPEHPDYPKNTQFNLRFGPRGVLTMHSNHDRDSGGRSPLRKMGQAELRGHRPTRQKANGDGGRGIPQSDARFHRPGEETEEAILCVVQSEPHAHLDSPET